jgi:F0F1-type ATP synthase membrane subunit a
MMAGHTLLKILIGFAFTIGMQGLSGNWVLVVAAIAVLQAYVFTVLMALYIKDLHTAH